MNLYSVFLPPGFGAKDNGRIEKEDEATLPGRSTRQVHDLSALTGSSVRGFGPDIKIYYGHGDETASFPHTWETQTQWTGETWGQTSVKTVGFLPAASLSTVVVPHRGVT